MSDETKRSIVDDIYQAEIPYHVVTNQIHLEMFSNKNLIINGAYTIMEYNDSIITLKLKKGLLQIIGSQLAIHSVNEERIVISGEIMNIGFER